MSRTYISRLGNTIVCGAITALFTLISSPASAQDVGSRLCPKFKDLFGREHPALVHGTVGRNTGLAAISRNAQIYGIANEMSRTVLPWLDTTKQPIVIHYGLTTTFGALRAPICSNVSNEYGPRYSLQMAKLDLGTFSAGAGGRMGPFSVYYGVSASVHTVAEDWGNRVWGAMTVPFLASAMAPFVAPFKRDFVRDDFSLTLDFIAGLQYHSPVGAIGVGYLGSQGIFTNFSEKHIRAFAGLVVNRLEDAANIPYLALGFESLDWLVGRDGAKSIGHTKIFGRKLQFPAAPPPGAAVTSAITEGTKPSDFITAHLEQTAIAQHLDVHFTYAAKPTPSIYEAALGYRVGDELPNKSSDADGEPKEQFFRLLVGFVKLPDLWFYGVQGGIKPRVSIQTSGIIPWAPGAGYVPLVLALGINDPELLAAFPYAYNAVQATMRLGFK